MAQAHGWHTESAFMIDTFPCPKCNRTLTRSGAVEIEGATFPVFQCDECLVKDARFGDMEFAYTFALGPDGEPFDPASEDGELPI